MKEEFRELTKEIKELRETIERAIWLLRQQNGEYLISYPDDYKES